MYAPSTSQPARVPGRIMSDEMAEQPALKAVERGPFSVPESDSDQDLIEFVRRAGQSV